MRHHVSIGKRGNASPWQAAWVTFLCAVWLLVLAGEAQAHEFRPGVLSLVEQASGSFSVAWKPPLGRSATAPSVVTPIFPAHCEVSPLRLNCGAKGLSGSLHFSAESQASDNIHVNIQWLGGTTTARILETSTSLKLYGAPKDAAFVVLMPLLMDYGALGFEHIAFGFDHLLFVLGLFLLISLRRLWLTITAFTLAHCLTLGAATFGLVTLPGPPVELCIALSILLLAREVLTTAPTLTKRHPWLIAFGFGLLHGFGFAGALSEIGLPPKQAISGLLAFNLGVEAGQLVLILGLMFTTLAVAKLRPSMAKGRRQVAYAMGGAAAYWTIERTLALLA